MATRRTIRRGGPKIWRYGSFLGPGAERRRVLGAIRPPWRSGVRLGDVGLRCRRLEKNKNKKCRWRAPAFLERARSRARSGRFFRAPRCAGRCGPPGAHPVPGASRGLGAVRTTPRPEGAACPSARTPRHRPLARAAHSLLIQAATCQVSARSWPAGKWWPSQPAGGRLAATSSVDGAGAARTARRERCACRTPRPLTRCIAPVAPQCAPAAQCQCHACRAQTPTASSARLPGAPGSVRAAQTGRPGDCKRMGAGRCRR